MYSIGKFAKLIGRSIETLRSWDKQGKLIPSYRSEGGHRMYSEEQLNQVLQIVKPKERFNLGYIRVSAKHQNSDLERQNEQTDEEELVDDILNIIHVFSCRLNGKRSHINKKIMEKLKNDK